MSVEDNTYDFKVRDRLREEYETKRYAPYLNSSSVPHRNGAELMLDMMTYCSQGNQEEAVLNLKATERFQNKYEAVRWSMPGPKHGVYATGEVFIYEFWRKCFIQTKVAVQKGEPLPSESWHVVIFRDYGRFLNSANFSIHDAFKTETRVAIESLKNASDNFNNTYKALMKRDRQKEN